MEYIEEAFADRRGEDVVLQTIVFRPDPSQCQENSQRRTHAEEVFNLQQIEQGGFNMTEQRHSSIKGCQPWILLPQGKVQAQGVTVISTINLKKSVIASLCSLSSPHFSLKIQ